MLNWTSVLLIAGPVVLLLVALRQRDARAAAPFSQLLLIYVICAAAPLVFALVWRLDATRASIELHGIAFRSSGATLRKDVRERRAGSGRIVIGDAPVRRGRVAQNTFGTLVFVPARTTGNGALRIELPRPERRAGLIATGNDGLLGAEVLADGDSICIAGTCWTYDARALSFSNGKQVIAIPARQAELPGLDWRFPLPFAKPITAGLRTWSLDFIAHQGGAIAPERQLRSFVAHSNPGAKLRLVDLDEDVVLRRNGTAVSSTSSFVVDDGARISFYSLPPQSAEFAAPGIAERRSVIYRAGERSFVLDLDTPEVHTLTMRELQALQLAQEQGTSKKRVALSMGDAQLVDRSLYFAGLSESVAVEANALFELSRFFPRDFASTFRIISPRGPVDAQLGAVQWVGSSDLAAIRLDVLRPPLFLLAIGMLLLLFKAGAASAARFTTTQALMAGAIELLAGVRLLMGYRVWSMPPHRIEAAELALVAWMALPWIFIAAAIPIRSLSRWRDARTDAAPALAGLLFSAIFTARVVEGPTKWVWVFCHLLAIVFALARAEEVRARFNAITLRVRQSIARMSDRMRGYARGWRGKMPASAAITRVVLGGVFALVVWLALRNAIGPIAIIVVVLLAFAIGFFAGTLIDRSRRFFDPELTPIIVTAIAFTIVRIALLAFGWKESASFGVRMSLSVIHIPAAAILQGFFIWRTWRRVSKNGRLLAPDLAAAAAILLFVWIIPAAVTSDVGLALLNVPLFVFLLVAVSAHSRAKEGRWLRYVLVAGVLVLLAGGPLARLILPLFASEDWLLSAASDSNFARVLHFAAPERLQDLATKRGESLAITSAILQSYISSGLFGRGYGHSEVSVHLGDTALRDFAPSVFIAAEWGLIGTVSMLLIYLLFAIIAADWLPWNRSRIGDARPGPAVAFMAAATIAVSSIYMILANHELLLLTGKNAYLFGLDSAGDVIEVIALVLLIAYGSSVTRDDTRMPSQGRFV